MKDYCPNLNYIKEMSEGDAAFEENLLKVMKSEFKRDSKVYVDDFSKAHYLKCAQMVHKMLHKITILGLLEGHKMAKKHEEALKKSDTKYHSEFLEILKAMSNFLESTKQ